MVAIVVYGYGSVVYGSVGGIWQRWWYMLAVVVYGYRLVVVYGYGFMVVYGYGFRAVAEKQKWYMGDDDGAAAA